VPGRRDDESSVQVLVRAVSFVLGGALAAGAGLALARGGIGERGVLPTAGMALTAAVLVVYSCWPRKARRRKPPPPSAAAEAPRRGTVYGVEGGAHGGRDARKLARKLEARIGELGAEAVADLMLDEGLRDEAARLFVEHELFVRAAEVRHDQNRFDEAADLYERAGCPEAAGQAFAQVQRYADAARCYREAGKYSVAGEMFQKAGMHREAATAYREIGFHRLASEAFQLAGDEASAADCMVAAFTEEGGGASAHEDRQRELAALGAKAGELLFKLERFEEAERILMRAGAFGPAARVAFHRGAYERAAELFLRVRRGDLAARALSQLGDEAGAARVMGAFLREKGDDAAAAEQLERAGEYQEAGDLLRKLERFEEAGECYRKACDHSSAAEMFRVSGQPVRAAEAFQAANLFDLAAECYGEAGEPLRQAEMLEKGGQLFAAGVLFAGSGRPDDALRLLQRIESGDPRFGEACSVLGRIFAEKGMHSLAVRKFEEAIGGRPVGRDNVAAYYELAEACESRGDPAKAAEIFEKILGFDYHYRDTAERAERAKAQGEALVNAAAASVLGSGAGTSPTLRRYEVRQEIGRGGMGVVYRARDCVLERDVAFKVLPDHLRRSPSALQHFLREAKAAAQLNHANIVTVYDAGESEHGFYLAMELVDGTTLKEIVQRRGPLPAAGVLFILRQIASALAFAHSRKVVHRDIKTANIMWTRDKQVKIMDFGLAKLMEEVRNTNTVVSGTPFYMSPEQTLGRSVDHRTDLYSLGVTLFELATGRLPFRRGNIPYHHVHTPAPDPRQHEASLPDELARVILRCLEKSPDARFQSAGDLLEGLGKLG
jgi:tetratricopeptide (TPR) repeat protein